MSRKARVRNALLCCVVVVMMLAMGAVGVFAEGETTQATINTAVSTALGTVQNDAMSLIASVLPYALAIVGAVLVVTIGIKVFKRVSGR